MHNIEMYALINIFKKNKISLFTAKLKSEINKTKGMITKDLLNTKLTGSLETNTRVINIIMYKEKQPKASTGVNIVNKIQLIKVIIFIRASILCRGESKLL